MTILIYMTFKILIKYVIQLATYLKSHPIIKINKMQNMMNHSSKKSNPS